ncbi:hypothetical protein Gotri_011420 [Gossypium trilobum]|uniref:Uncharacterized protein n=1 Tax=Gossypium trilobum TaxID=34281 RepID=A0A7J9ETR3_9ROSI|nr:hypothetical protein [Gossypium trilobum]
MYLLSVMLALGYQNYLFIVNWS